MEALHIDSDQSQAIEGGRQITESTRITNGFMLHLYAFLRDHSRLTNVDMCFFLRRPQEKDTILAQLSRVTAIKKKKRGNYR